MHRSTQRCSKVDLPQPLEPAMAGQQLAVRDLEGDLAQGFDALAAHGLEGLTEGNDPHEREATASPS
jgi:hypothetical protein